MKVLLLSAYAARSHVHWQNALQRMFADWQWSVLTLPPRHFSWRVRGNALFWSMVERQTLEEPHDLLIATSMVDLATLRGLVPALSKVPTVLYFHENQFDYPQDRQQYTLLEAQITSIYSALAADCLVFNSYYNRDSFMAGSAALLCKLPDRVPPTVVFALEQKAVVLPVPFDEGALRPVVAQWPGQTARRPLRLLWVGRFEHDKGGDSLLLILQQLEERALDYELAMTGQQFREAPPAFETIQSVFGHRLVHCGYIASETQYQALLQAADVVLSTALHEFQGLAVLQAVARECLPIVPDRLVYPEIYPSCFRYDSHPEDPAREAAAAADLIVKVAFDLPGYRAVRPDIRALTLHHLTPQYEDVLCSTAAGQHSQ